MNPADSERHLQTQIASPANAERIQIVNADIRELALPAFVFTAIVIVATIPIHSDRMTCQTVFPVVLTRRVLLPEPIMDFHSPGKQFRTILHLGSIMPLSPMPRIIPVKTD